MDRAEVAVEIKKIVKDQAGVSDTEIKEEQDFKHDLGFDSLDAVEIIMQIEDNLDINVPDEEAEKAADGTVKDLIDLVLKIVESGKDGE